MQTVETDRETEREEMEGMEGDIKGPLVAGLSPGEEDHTAKITLQHHLFPTCKSVIV